MRLGSEDPYRRDKGSAVYHLACQLYEEDLPYKESDICTLLLSSKHDCGHGGDVTPPFEVAVKWARANGVTSRWLAAMRTFIEGLRGLHSAKANHLKAKGGLVLLLDGDKEASARCPGGHFRRDLSRLPPAERGAWQRVVLSMGTGMGPRPPKGFDVQAYALSAFLGVPETIARLERWLPRPASGPCKLETAGSLLLRNFVWLLLFISADAKAAPSCDTLVDHLARVDFAPAQRGKKVAVACAVYFSQRPPAVGREPLETLLARTMAMAKGSFDTDSIRKIVDSYLSRAVR
jgi:hypothetical protein